MKEEWKNFFKQFFSTALTPKLQLIMVYYGLLVFICQNLNLGMSHNNSMSFESGNEFMPSEQKNQGPSFDQFMQTCFNNPAFFESMKHFYLSQSQKTQAPVINNIEASGTTHGYQQYQNSSFNYSREAPKQQGTLGEEIDNEPILRQPQDIKKKPANPLAKFIPAETSKSEKPNEPFSKPSQPQKIQSFDDRPIKSNFTSTVPNTSSSFDLNAIKQNKSMNIDNPVKKVMSYDEIPIKGAKQYQIDSYLKEEGQKKNSSGVNYDMDERPLTGCAKDFKQLLKEKFPDAIVPEGEEKDHYEQKKENRTFLKRGSRQHLSSALDKSKQPKKDTSMTKSEIQDNRSITPRRNAPEGRSTSQNRVLAKKNANQNSSRAIPKAPTAKNDESFDEQLSTKAKPPLNRQRPPKPDPPSTRAANKPIEKITIASNSNSNQKKKAKNVFNDQSQQSSSSEEEPAPYFKASQKKPEPALSIQKNNITKSDDLLEVIDGVYLTKEQLDEIVEKYVKIQPVVKQTESEKISALRKKYNEMMALMEEQRQQNRCELEREKEEFQRYKAQQMNKLKNQRRVMERQVKSTIGSHAAQKEKEQLEQLKQDLQREREQTKRRQKNSRIMLEKYKKENEQLKSKLERLELDRDNKSMTSKRSATTIKQDDDKVSVSKNNPAPPKGKKIEEEFKVQEISYKDIKKGKGSQQKETLKAKQTKYQYVEEDSRVKNKSTSIKNQSICIKNQPKDNKYTNKWVSHKFDSESENSASQSEGDDNVSQVTSSRGVQWSPAMKLSDLCKVSLSIKMVTDQMIKSLFRHENNLDFLKYQQSLQSPSRTVVNTTRNAKNDYTAKLYSDRSKELIYDNGTRKISFENGYSLVYFKNGDIKQTLPDKTVLYYFKQKQVDQITLPTGVNIYRFENNQVQFHFDNGYIEIRHPDGTTKVLGGEHTRR